MYKIQDPVICMSEFGEVPDDLDFRFPSIRVLSEEDKSELVEKASAPILAAYDSGVIGRKTALKELRQLGDTTSVFTNITEKQIDEAEEEPQLPGEMMPGEGVPGAPQLEAGGPGKPKSPKALMSETGATSGSDAAMDRALHKRMKWHGLDISIENRAGSTRSGTDSGGNEWQVVLTHDYGY